MWMSPAWESVDRSLVSCEIWPIKLIISVQNPTIQRTNNGMIVRFYKCETPIIWLNFVVVYCRKETFSDLVLGKKIQSSREVWQGSNQENVQDHSKLFESNTIFLHLGGKCKYYSPANLGNDNKQLGDGTLRIHCCGIHCLTVHYTPHLTLN